MVYKSLNPLTPHCTRLLLQTMIMTGSDLCSSVKSWQNQFNTVQDIYNEFYMQGDKEIASGRLPVPIMNRFCRDEQAHHQVRSLLTFLHSNCLAVIRPHT